MLRRFIPFLVVLAVSIPAGARAQSGASHFEIFGGEYRPQHLDDQLTYGIRASRQISGPISIELSVGRLEFQEHPGEVDSTLVDLSLKAYLTPAGKARYFLVAGPGRAFVHASVIQPDVLSEDTFTTHVGAGVDLWLSDRLYLRPDVLGRWYKTSEGSNVDWQITFALGLAF
jgi:outer membrane protein with beta-barrel domain